MSHVEKVLKSPHAAAVVEQHPPSANLPSANMVKEVTPSRNTLHPELGFGVGSNSPSWQCPS
jgi:hypothetical protein